VILEETGVMTGVGAALGVISTVAAVGIGVAFSVVSRYASG
jgi:hypothetical protein